MLWCSWVEDDGSCGRGGTDDTGSRRGVPSSISLQGWPYPLHAVLRDPGLQATSSRVKSHPVHSCGVAVFRCLCRTPSCCTLENQTVRPLRDVVRPPRKAIVKNDSVAQAPIVCFFGGDALTSEPEKDFPAFVFSVSSRSNCACVVRVSSRSCF